MQNYRFGTAILVAMSSVFLGNNAEARSRISTEQIDRGVWRLTIERESFSGGSRCWLYAPHGRSFYEDGAVALRLGRHRDPQHAIYRVDGGSPRSYRNDLPELVRLGAPIDSGPIGRSSGGLLWIPYSRLTGATAIWVETGARSKLLWFRFTGLEELRELAARQGCSPEFEFVR